MFKVTILNFQCTLYEGEARSILLPGSSGYFEILDYHHPIIAILKDGEIIIDNKIYLAIERGLVSFYNNELLALVEE